MQQWYELLFPEADGFDHELEIKTDLASVGVSSLEEAFAAGYLLLRLEPLQLFHERQLPIFHDLADEVALRRRSAKANQEEQAANQRSTKQRELCKVLEVSASLTDEESMWLSQQLAAAPESGASLEEWRERISKHQQTQRALSLGNHATSVCACQTCLEGLGRLRQRWTSLCEAYLGGYLKRYWPAPSALSLLQQKSPESFALDDPDLPDKVAGCLAWGHQQLREAFAQQVQDRAWLAGGEGWALPTQEEIEHLQSPWSLTEEASLEALMIGLRGVEEQLHRRQERQERVRSMHRLFEDSFLVAWEEKAEEWRRWWGAHAVSLPSHRAHTQDEAEKIISSFGQKARRERDVYEGVVPVEEALASIHKWIKACEEALHEALVRQQRRASFQQAYKHQSRYASCFEKARQLRRKILYFAGPTNSGKTYAAFERLAQSKSGVYLAPLRLLALEGQHHLLDRGRDASLLTGEERDIRPKATFQASTIEMMQLEKVVGCAILDEIQMIAHPQRGWAWVQALIGMPAHQLILTGSADALPLVEKLCELTEDELEVHHFERKNELQLLEQPASLEELPPGTAVICFSRREVLGLKRELERLTGEPVAVIYGALGPEVRRYEAERFRSGEAPLLVATDAIGMGLNLPIRRVLFWSMEKTSEGLLRRLTPSEILQIAGRAGRYGLQDKGEVGVFQESELPLLREALETSLPPLQGPLRVMPLPSHLTLLQEHLQSDSLPALLQAFELDAWFQSELFVPHVPQSMKTIAERLAPLLEGAPLALQITFSRAPVSHRSEALLDALASFAKAHLEGRTWAPPEHWIQAIRLGQAEDDRGLRMTEQLVKELTLYCWLAYRFPDSFPLSLATSLRHLLNRVIRRTLSENLAQRRCRHCGVVLHPLSRYGWCRGCAEHRR